MVSQPETRMDKATSSALMPIAHEAIKLAKKDTNLLPARLLHHVPGFDALLRPINTLRVIALSGNIAEEGFRANEPVLISPPFRKLRLPRYILGGNHRSVASRNSGMVLLQSFVLSEKHIIRMMDILTQRMKLELKDPQKVFSIDEQRTIFFQCISLLIVATQLREPSPKPATILQMVGMVRTFVKNDPDVPPYTRNTGPYGGLDAVRKMMFGDIPSQADGSVHFLLDMTKGKRHMNKLLRGTFVLIETAVNTVTGDTRSIRSILDLLLNWEECGLMPPFTVTHLAHVGSIPPERASDIADRAHSEICNNLASQTADPALKLPVYRMGKHGVGDISDPKEASHEDEGNKGDADVGQDADDGDDEIEDETGDEKGDGYNHEEGESENGNDDAHEVEDGIVDIEHDTENVQSTALRRSSRKRKQVSSYSQDVNPTTSSSRPRKKNKVQTKTSTKTSEAQKIEELEADLRAARTKMVQLQGVNDSHFKALLTDAVPVAEARALEEAEQKYKEMMNKFTEENKAEYRRLDQEYRKEKDRMQNQERFVLKKEVEIRKRERRKPVQQRTNFLN